MLLKWSMIHDIAAPAGMIGLVSSRKVGMANE